jgi:hypothetical protein
LITDVLPNDEMQRTSDGNAAGSPLISVFGGPQSMALGIPGKAAACVTGMSLVLMGCAQQPRHSAVRQEATCPSIHLESSRTFQYMYANEWMTGRLRVVGCAVDIHALQAVADGPAFARLAAVAKGRPSELPYCREGTTHPELADQINAEVGENLVKDACATVLADI